MAMTTSKALLSHAKVLELLAYDEQTGHLTWRTGLHSKRAMKGKRAGSLHKKSGYRRITLLGKSFLEHHVVWFYQTGKWAKEIDHENHVKDDNSWKNLSEKSHKENTRNMKQISGTITGLQGIIYDRAKGCYHSRITVDGKRVFQKTYQEADLELAITERKAMLLQLGFHSNHGN